MITQRDISDLKGNNLYLRRWSLWLPFGWSIKLHKIVRTDDDRCEHDHPWDFFRIILWGGYTEVRNGFSYILKPWRPWAPWRIYPCRSEFKHRIVHLTKGYNWSLVICSPKKRAWGFYTKLGWKYWKDFVNSSDRIQWCDDGRQV